MDTTLKAIYDLCYVGIYIMNSSDFKNGKNNHHYDFIKDSLSNIIKYIVQHEE